MNQRRDHQGPEPVAAVKACTIETLLSPRSVAIVGASGSVHKAGGRPLNYLMTQGYAAGRIYAVNPRSDIVRGVKTYPSLEALPEVSGVAVLCIVGGGMGAAGLFEAPR